jgi:hypothetical protein
MPMPRSQHNAIEVGPSRSSLAGHSASAPVSQLKRSIAIPALGGEHLALVINSPQEIVCFDQ